jgi:hypothetical protein
MEKVIGIEADRQDTDQWVVTTSKKNQRYHIDDRENSSATSQLGDDGVVVSPAVVEMSTVGQVGDEVDEEDKTVEPRRNAAHVHCGGQLHLSIVAFAFERGVDHVLLHSPPNSPIQGPVPLLISIQTHAGEVP